MSVSELGRLADVLIRHVNGLEVRGSLLFPFPHTAVEAADLDAMAVPLRGHPADHLRWYRPTPGCVALGLVSGGWAAPIDSPVRPSAHPEARRVVQAVVLGSDGVLVGRLRLPDGAVVDAGRDGYGSVPDALRRAMRRAA